MNNPANQIYDSIPSTPRDELLALHLKLSDECRAIIAKKNTDYAGGTNDPYANFRTSEVLGVDPALGILMRCMDKFQRIRSFIANGTLAVQEEGVLDAIMDVMNYMVLLAGYLQSKKQLIQGQSQGVLNEEKINILQKSGALGLSRSAQASIINF